MPMLPITTQLAALAAVSLVGLSFSVSLKRMKAGTDIGMGDDPGLLRRIRAQGNFIEYVPLALILCAIAELRGASSTWLWALAGLLVLGRAAHATGKLQRLGAPCFQRNILHDQVSLLHQCFGDKED